MGMNIQQSYHPDQCFGSTILESIFKYKYFSQRFWPYFFDHFHTFEIEINLKNVFIFEAIQTWNSVFICLSNIFSYWTDIGLFLATVALRLTYTQLKCYLKYVPTYMLSINRVLKSNSTQEIKQTVSWTSAAEPVTSNY